MRRAGEAPSKQPAGASCRRSLSTLLPESAARGSPPRAPRFSNGAAYPTALSRRALSQAKPDAVKTESQRRAQTV